MLLLKIFFLAYTKDFFMKLQFFLLLFVSASLCASEIPVSHLGATPNAAPIPRVVRTLVSLEEFLKDNAYCVLSSDGNQVEGYEVFFEQKDHEEISQMVCATHYVSLKLGLTELGIISKYNGDFIGDRRGQSDGPHCIKKEIIHNYQIAAALDSTNHEIQERLKLWEQDVVRSAFVDPGIVRSALLCVQQAASQQ